MAMMEQHEMLKYLQARSKSHKLDIKSNKIIGRKLIASQSFLGFTLTYLKNNKGVSLSLNVPSHTRRFVNDRDLICALGAFSDIG